MKLYRIAKSNRIVPDYKLEIVDEIFGVGMVENLVKNHTITEIEKLNVIDCLKYGNKVVAIKCYMQIHNCTSVVEAKNMVDAIEEDLKKWDDISRK